jgi:hypothetical protein
MTYTERFSEAWEKVAEITPQSIAGETNLAARVDISGFTRLAVIIGTNGGDTLDVDFEQASALTGGTLKTLASNGKDVTVAAETGFTVVEIRSEEFDTNPGIVSVETFKWFNVEITPAGATIVSVVVLGLAKSKPAVNTWDAIVD